MPGETQCADNGGQTCDAEGDWGGVETCAVACVDGACATPPSCQALAVNCGASSNDSCCTSLLVTGGTYNRGNDADYPATVSDFRLDKYEVTGGRFRKFVDAVVAGWRPGSGSGKHTHLNSGSGLSNSGDAEYEPGWDEAWNQADATHGMYDTKADWNTSLACGADYETWTASAAGNETRPINCINWYQAYAFCIWDEGFLPSEAEWNYAAAGGSAQREYPWSSPASSTTIDCTYANYSGCPPDVDLVGASSPNGDGRYGQSDLAGNVWEWSLDRWSSAYTTPCSNCAHLPLSDPYGMFRGGSFGSSTSYLLSSHRSDYALERRNYDVGVRCARTP